ncbi:decaprenyl-diphosphate synthase subunit 1 isoform X2 [Drosophila busckii]|uniref:decaprenyl-diphosphate synthase subunit 1 isoform X2 n=1 Tax=Drosophila busckii TaxID=30019 RepID=UPI00083F48DD|nr:decaprenyl-diphosphate synthase subunit 1 isoform X2 [Drosophila busckii]
MACLSTSGRVVCATRRQQAHKFICRLFLNHSLRRQSSIFAGIIAPVQGVKEAKLPQEAQQRRFHGLSFSIAQDYLSLTQSPHSCRQNSRYTHSKINVRKHSSVHTQQPAGPVREIQIDPYIILDDELKYFYDDVRDLLQSGTSQPELDTIACYYFDGQGKALRPMVTMLMAKALNYHLNNESHQLVHKQRQIALFSEMVHSASLVHDDVIDQSDFRRGKPSVNALWNHKKVTMAGDYILSIASIMIARLRSDDVTIVLSQELLHIKKEAAARLF